MCENLKKYVVEHVDERIKNDNYLVDMLRNNYDIIVKPCCFSNNCEMENECMKVYIKYDDDEKKGFFCGKCNKYMCSGCYPTKGTIQNMCFECFINVYPQNKMNKKFVCKYCNHDLTCTDQGIIRSLYCLHCKSIFTLENFY